MCSFYILNPDSICNADVVYFSFFVQYPEFLKNIALLVLKQIINLIDTMEKQYSVCT